jgi:hypothetical protein
MTAIITAYSAMSWPSCCDHNLCIIKNEFPVFLRFEQWLVRGGYRSTEYGCYSGNSFLRTYQRHGPVGPFMPVPPPGSLRLSSFRGRAVRPNVLRLAESGAFCFGVGLLPSHPRRLVSDLAMSASFCKLRLSPVRQFTKSLRVQLLRRMCRGREIRHEKGEWPRGELCPRKDWRSGVVRKPDQDPAPRIHINIGRHSSNPKR